MNGELIILDRSGDMKLIWSADKAAEIETAREMFEKMKKKGYLAYTVNKKHEKGEVIRSFDPDVEKIIMTPAMQGG